MCSTELTRSELGHRSHAHDRLDMGVVQIRNLASVESRVASRVELLLIDVTILVANGRCDIARDKLGQVDDLWTQIGQSLSVRLLKKLTRASTEEARLEQQA